MLLAAIGDIHGAFDALEAAMARQPDAAFWLCVGDVASETGAYPSPPRPFYFIKGNNEDFDVLARLASGVALAATLHFLPNGQLTEIDGLRVAGLGGTFAPKWYETPPGDLPPAPAASRQSHARAKADDKRRHLVRTDVEACKALRGVDIFLSHEAPRPYWVGTARGRNDAGKTVVNEVLAAMQPRLHLFGHHHRFSQQTVQGVPSICLPMVTEGYLLIDTAAWTWTMKPAALSR